MTIFSFNEPIPITSKNGQIIFANRYRSRNRWLAIQYNGRNGAKIMAFLKKACKDYPSYTSVYLTHFALRYRNKLVYRNADVENGSYVVLFISHKSQSIEAYTYTETEFREEFILDEEQNENKFGYHSYCSKSVVYGVQFTKGHSKAISDWLKSNRVPSTARGSYVEIDYNGGRGLHATAGQYIYFWPLPKQYNIVPAYILNADTFHENYRLINPVSGV